MPRKEILELTVNGDPYQVAAAPHQTLLEVLREALSLTGTKRGCDDASCGACTVLIGGRPALSCIRLALTAAGAEVTTIEGARHSRLAVLVQNALAEHGGIQCGYCTPGIVLAAQALLDANPHPDERQLREGLSNNLCRCTGYTSIIGALEKAISKEAAV
jgi:carbon-monoxide dehydrogenase small subunit